MPRHFIPSRYCLPTQCIILPPQRFAFRRTFDKRIFQGKFHGSAHFRDITSYFLLSRNFWGRGRIPQEKPADVDRLKVRKLFMPFHVISRVSHGQWPGLVRSLVPTQAEETVGKCLWPKVVNHLTTDTATDL